MFTTVRLFPLRCDLVKAMGACASNPNAPSGDGYYAEIYGLKLDKSIIDACAGAVKGQGDGRVSKRRCPKEVLLGGLQVDTSGY